MKKVLLFVYFIFILIVRVTSFFAFEDEVQKEENVGDPLILTPLIEDNKIEEARNKSKVDLGVVESYSGYLTVNTQFKSNLFFWFFPAEFKTVMQKIILWIQGEPGISSLFGLFTESGPMEIQLNRSIRYRSLSWTKTNHILYIDSPVGTGYSFTDGGYSENATQVAKELYIALFQFYKLFPEYKENKLYIAGRYLAGKYLPELANIIKTHNKKTKIAKINLHGLIMGNALSDPIRQIKYGEYLFELGLINSAQKKDIMDEERSFRFSVRMEQYYEAYTSFQKMITSPHSMFRKYTKLQDYNSYNYNYRNNSIGWLYSITMECVTSNELRSMIHVGNVSFHHDDKVDYYIQNDTMKSVVNLVSDLLEDYEMHFYSGQFDIIINYPGTMKFIDSLKYQNYNKTLRVLNQSTGTYSSKTGNLYVDFIMGAGHMTTYDNPHYMFNKIKDL